MQHYNRLLVFLSFRIYISCYCYCYDYYSLYYHNDLPAAKVSLSQTRIFRTFDNRKRTDGGEVNCVSSGASRWERKGDEISFFFLLFFNIFPQG